MDCQEDSRDLEQGPETEPGLEPEREDRPDPSQLNAIKGLYEHFREVPLKALDIFIGVCVAALVIVVAVGIFKARGL